MTCIFMIRYSCQVAICMYDKDLHYKFLFDGRPVQKSYKITIYVCDYLVALSNVQKNAAHHKQLL